VERVSYEPEGNSAFRADPRVFPQIGWQGLNEFFPTHRELARIAHAGREREPDPGREIRFDRNVWFGNVENGAAAIVGRETVQYVSNVYKYYIAYKLVTREMDATEAARKNHHQMNAK